MVYYSHIYSVVEPEPAGAGLFSWSRSRSQVKKLRLHKVATILVKFSHISKLYTTKTTQDSLRFLLFSSVAEPEPVETKLFGTWSRSRNYIFYKHFLQSVWRMLVQYYYFRTSVAEPEPVEPKLFGTWSRSRNYGQSRSRSQK